ncbi:M3 family metallopeptidase [candidate division KSB1 bacterium]|nr:M3 family metallopeptidase [candidate division KSB1 bacterium]
MKISILFLLLMGILGLAFAKTDSNPFFHEFNTPFQVPPFQELKTGHYLPAFQAGIEQQQKEIQAIVQNPASVSFENTLIALEKSGSLLTRVQNVFYNINSANTSDSIQAIAKEVAPLLSKHADDIFLNEKLFQRIKAVYAQKAQLKLTTEQQRLLEKYYQDFVRGGANLTEPQKERLRAINKELSLISLQFGENVLKEDNNFKLVIENQADLAGLPEQAIAAAAEAAQAQGLTGKWVFTLHKPSLIPFLQAAQNRALRELMFKAYIQRGDHQDQFDNNNNLTRIAALRAQKAQLLGYPTYAHFVLAENMAQVPEKVYQLLQQLWQPALGRAQAEARALQAMITQAGQNFKLQPWDWWYYAEKVKKAKYDLDDEVLRPYFQLENVRQGAFDVAQRLWGLRFEPRPDLPTYHPEIKAFEVKEADGAHIGILYCDYHPRASKRGGAWMSEFRKQSKIDGKPVTPVVTNVFNFSRPTADTPALLSYEEVLTLFHEFGHALHGLLSNCTYPLLSGTDVARDFVELPSQIMENWASEPEVLKMYAKHYATGAPIPDELIAKIRNARLFNQGFETVEYLAASFLDMDWHTLTDTSAQKMPDFENQALNKIGLIPEIVVRYRSPFFRHIFAGGYPAGYYSYIWAEVLDADAFQAFKTTSLFNPTLAAAFRKNILARGGTEAPMTLYKNFRGAEPNIESLLERRGLK